jgi:hypothetical protein
MKTFGQPFMRARLMATAIAAIMASTGGNLALQQQQLAALGPYESRGKGKGGGNRRAAGAGMASKRKAIKLRNVKRHLARCH